MRRARTGLIVFLLVVSAAVSGCAAPAGPALGPSIPASPSVTVLRASKADREAAAAAMQAVTDHFGGAAWAAAKALADLPTAEDRTRGGGYDRLMDLTGSGRLDAAGSVVVPLLSGKSLDDFGTWQTFQGRVVHLISALQQWGAGDDSAEADAAAALKDARADIEKLRR